MSTGDDFGHRYGRNSEFCVTAGHVTRTAGIGGVAYWAGRTVSRPLFVPNRQALLLALPLLLPTDFFFHFILNYYARLTALFQDNHSGFYRSKR